MWHSRQGGLGDEGRMFRNSWRKALTVSLLLHCFLLLGIGWLAVGHTVTLKEEQNLEVDLVSPVVSEATAAERVPDEKVTVVSNKAAPKPQPPKEDTPHVAPAKNGPPAARASDKDEPVRGLSPYSKEQLDVALAKYNEILLVNLPVAILYSDRGRIYYDMGDLDKALVDFNQALALQTDLPVAHVGRGFTYIRKDQWELALDDFNQAIATAPQNALAYYGRALCFIKSGDKLKATDDLRSFIQYATPEYDRLVQTAHQLLAELDG
jgi:tetratricopeptide (TPR) repeat protein